MSAKYFCDVCGVETKRHGEPVVDKSVELGEFRGSVHVRIAYDTGTWPDLCDQHRDEFVKQTLNRVTMLMIGVDEEQQS